MSKQERAMEDFIAKYPTATMGNNGQSTSLPT
jgi:hypothetical protein